MVNSMWGSQTKGLMINYSQLFLLLRGMYTNNPQIEEYINILK